MAISVLRLPDVSKQTGLARSTIYKFISEGNFPRPINLGPRAVGWLIADIDEWINSRIKTSQVPSCKQ